MPIARPDSKIGKCRLVVRVKFNPNCACVECRQSLAGDEGERFAEKGIEFFVSPQQFDMTCPHDSVSKGISPLISPYAVAGKNV